MFVEGFLMAAGLIVAIGAQNAFVIKQGLTRQHLFLTAIVCSLLDAFLITLGVGGFGEILSQFPVAISISRYFAIVFLVIYGAISFKHAFQKEQLKKSDEPSKRSVKRLLMMLCALSLLNPHAYLDTVILLGSVAAQYEGNEKLWFGVGAVSASFVWFFSITYASRFLAPLLAKPIAWKVIDCIVGFIMWGIALGLAL